MTVETRQLAHEMVRLELVMRDAERRGHLEIEQRYRDERDEVRERRSQVMREVWRTIRHYNLAATAAR